MTNREWLISLTDKQLAEFLTTGLYVRTAHYIVPYLDYISIKQIAVQYTQSAEGIEKWLSMPQDYIAVEEE